MPIFIAVLLFIFLGLFVVFVLFFVSRRFSPIPYFPSNGRDIPIILKLLALKDRQILYDLGAGDGAAILAAALARQSPAKASRFVAVEINPILIGIIKLRTFFHPNKQNITTVKANIFTFDIPRSPGHTPLFFMYISPWYMEKTIVNLLRQFRSIELVTYFYAAPRSKRYALILRKHRKNIHSTYRYTVTRTDKV